MRFTWTDICYTSAERHFNIHFSMVFVLRHSSVMLQWCVSEQNHKEIQIWFLGLCYAVFITKCNGLNHPPYFSLHKKSEQTMCTKKYRLGYVFLGQLCALITDWNGLITHHTFLISPTSCCVAYCKTCSLFTGSAEYAHYSTKHLIHVRRKLIT